MAKSPNGTTSNYSYDEANRLKALDHLGGTTSFARFDYAYNNVSNRKSRTETDNGKKVLDAYDYDAIDQVAGAKYNFNAQANTQDRLVNYAYVVVGNRLELTDEKSIGYATNNLNQYVTVGDDTPTYDLNGNLKSQGIWTYAYDAENRLRAASDGTTGYAFAYDARNRCVSRAAPASFKYCYYDGWNLIEELDANWNLLARYLHGAKTDELVARNEGSAPHYYYADALGNNVALTSGFFGNTPVERYSYDIFGAPTFRDGSGNVIASSAYDNRFLFTGREYLPELGLYDYRHRIYSPNLGRFLQTDPIRFGGRDVNLYRYVYNNPFNLLDPTGELVFPGWVPPILIDIGERAAAGAVIGTVFEPGAGTVIGAIAGAFLFPSTAEAPTSGDSLPPVRRHCWKVADECIDGERHCTFECDDGTATHGTGDECEDDEYWDF